MYVAGLPRGKADAAAVNGTRPGESDARSLTIDKATGAVSVTTGEGAVWRSNPTPEEAAADTLAKTAASTELPVSIFTSLLGVPFLLYLILRPGRDAS